MTIVCSDPLHDTRSTDDGWSGDLGESAVSDSNSYLCEACALARATSVAVDPANTRNVIALAQGGKCALTAVRAYADGTIVGEIEKLGDVSDWPAGGTVITSFPSGTTKRQALRTLLGQLRDWLLTQ